MKKQRQFQLPKTNAQDCARRLLLGTKTKGMDKAGKQKALSIAKGILKELVAINDGDVNPEIFSLAKIRKEARFWTEVTHILSK